MCCQVAFAQPPRLSLSLNYTSVGLYNVTSDRANWINLLDAAADVRLWRDASFEVEMLAVNNLRNSMGLSGVADELPVFCCIEDGSVPLSLFKLGIRQVFGPVTLFLGVRNVNNDYFTSQWNSMYTASTNGLFPTLTHNFPLSDSPLSAMCLHIEWEIFNGFVLKNSLYNGVASDRWDEVFRVRPGRDGFFDIAEIGYKGTGYLGEYRAGVVWSNAYVEELARRDHRRGAWAIAEQPLYVASSGRELALLLNYGYTPSCCCDKYWGAGLVWRGLATTQRDYLGVMYNRSWHKSGIESDIEITYAYTHGCLTVQPAVHQIFASNRNRTVVMLKLAIDFGFQKQ